MADEQTTRDQVAQMLADKWTVREIAQRLDLSTQAVYYHAQRIHQSDKSRGVAATQPKGAA